MKNGGIDVKMVMIAASQLPLASGGFLQTMIYITFIRH